MSACSHIMNALGGVVKWSDGSYVDLAVILFLNYL